MIFASGAPAALPETVPWMGGKDDAQIRASIAAHYPYKRPATAAPSEEPAKSLGDRHII